MRENRKIQPILSILLILCLSFVASIHSFAAEYRPLHGSIRGKVFDRATQQRLVGANIILKDSRRGAASDFEGNFILEDIAPGQYILEVTMLGYKPMALTDIVVTPDRATYVSVGMEEDIISGEAVTVTAGYFIKDKDVVSSARNLNYEEIRRAVGGAEDVQRVIQALPGVAGENDQNNEIVVRGGSPRENLTVLNGMEIPNTNHFGYQGSTGGPINMVNTEFLSQVNFLTGGFPAKYGDKLSSVLQLELREGNRQEIEGSTFFNMAGFGGQMEGPLAKGNGSYIFSARKSYLDMINEPIGLTEVPEYWDLQSKLTFDLSSTQKLLFNGIYGNDRIKIEEKGGYSRGADRVDYFGDQYGVGLTLKSLWGKNTFSSAILSQTRSCWNVEVEDEDEVLVFTNNSTELENCFKFDFTRRLSARNELSIGVNIKQTVFDHDMWAKPDTTVYYFEGQIPGDSLEVVIIDSLVSEAEVNSYKFGAYLQDNFRLSRNLSVKAGLRYDYFDYSGKGELGPRLGVEWEFIPKNTLTASYGDFYQTAPYYYYTRANNPQNRHLDYEHARHYIVGYERLFNPDLKGTIELYLKKYDNMIMEDEWLHEDPSYHSETLIYSVIQLVQHRLW